MATEEIMALSPRRVTEPPSDDLQVAAFRKLIAALAANSSVLVVAMDDLNRYIDLWIRMGDDDEANEMAISDAVSEYHAATGLTKPIDEHLLLAHEPDRFFPKNLPILYRRHS
jgi:hypothetical protein